MPLTLKDHEKRIQELEKALALMQVRLERIDPQNARDVPPPPDAMKFR